MFCPNCGTKLEDDALFCGECGSNLQVLPIEEEVPAPAEEEVPAPAEEEVPAPAEEVPNPQPIPASVPVQESTLPKSNKGLVIGLIAGAAALFLLLMIAVICIIAGMGGGYKKPIKDFVSLVNKKSTNIEKYVDAALPDMFVDTYNTGFSIFSEIDGFEDAFEETQEEMEDLFDENADDYGKNWKITYEITDPEQLSKSELKDIKSRYKNLKNLLDYLDEDSYIYSALDEELKSKTMDKYDKMLSTLKKELKSVEITDGYVLDVELTIEGKEDYDSTEITIYVIKLNGKWVIDITSGDADIIYDLESMLYYYY